MHPIAFAYHLIHPNEYGPIQNETGIYTFIVAVFVDNKHLLFGNWLCFYCVWWISIFFSVQRREIFKTLWNKNNRKQKADLDTMPGFRWGAHSLRDTFFCSKMNQRNSTNKSSMLSPRNVLLAKCVLKLIYFSYKLPYYWYNWSNFNNLFLLQIQVFH